VARKLRLQFPGAIYHVLSRGDRREDVFRDDADRDRFIVTLGEACAKTSWKVHAFCLMRNHFHLVIETPEANLVAGMKWLLGTYTMRFNRRHLLMGHLFSGRYKSLLVGGEGGYLRTVCDYVHLNPVRASVLRPEEAIRSFRWSSFPSYLITPGQRPAWLSVDRVLGECGLPQDTAAGRKEFEQRLELLRGRDGSAELDAIRRDWCLANDEFRSQLLAQMNARVGSHYYGHELHEAAEEKAERMVHNALEHLGWTEDELRARRKGDPAKLAVARRLRRETTMSLQWVASRLCMGTKAYLAHLLYWEQHKKPERPPAKTAKGRRPGKQGRNTAISEAPQPDPAGELLLLRTDPVPFDTSFD
jgi:REP element-mobilizing transposase RayT